MGFIAEIYVLRHCTPAVSDQPNRNRPLSEMGYRQADSLVPILGSLGLAAVYTSPFRRSIETVTPRARVKWCVNDSGGDLLLLRDG